MGRRGKGVRVATRKGFNEIVMFCDIQGVVSLTMTT